MSAVRIAIAASLALALVAPACGAAPSPGSGAVVAPTTPAATRAQATATPRPTPRPSPLVSAKGSITVVEPASGETINGGVTVSGDATVFEGTLQYRVVTGGGKVLAEGHTTATAGAPQKGGFKVEVRFDAPYYGESGFVEVFERSPKDGSISDIVRVPVSISGTY